MDTFEQDIACMDQNLLAHAEEALRCYMASISAQNPHRILEGAEIAMNAIIHIIENGPETPWDIHRHFAVAALRMRRALHAAYKNGDHEDAVEESDIIDHLALLTTLLAKDPAAPARTTKQRERLRQTHPRRWR